MNGMAQRLQMINGDAVLEITRATSEKHRLSENTLLRRKENLEDSIAHFKTKLAEVSVSLALINTAKNEALAKSKTK